MTPEQVREIRKCYRSPAYFIGHYCHIYDAKAGDWVRFNLWSEQRATLGKFLNNLLCIVLKARQLGLTWLVLGFALWLMLFRPAATVLLFSRRDDEAVHLLDERLKGMFKRLPDWLRQGIVAETDNDHVWALSNGSIARAFPTSAGDSYTATLAIVDEADLVPNLNRLMRAVKPTIDNGGRMILLSRADKSEPGSEFKRIYRAARERLTNWTAVFLPWSVHPARDARWYAEQKADIWQRTGSLDDLYEQYPATDTEALSARTLDKRIAPHWLERVFTEQAPIEGHDGPAIPALRVYEVPTSGARYVIGVDPAEGNPTSDDSALTVLNAETGAEAAVLSGKFQPSTLAGHADTIGQWYNGAAVMVERNNHGHAVLLWLKDNSKLKVLLGRDNKPGWLSSTAGKVALYDATADAIRDGETVVRTFATMTQLGSVDGSTLRAPDGQHDDLADSFALALVARHAPSRVMTTGHVDFYA